MATPTRADAPPRPPGRYPSSRGISALLFCLLLIWALVPLAVVAVYAGRHGGQPTGAWSSLLVEDVFQYWAWIRESGDHVAIANLFDTGPPEHVFVYPPFLLSGLLWRAGVPIAIAYHLWTVAGAGVLAVSVTAYARRSLPEGGWRSAAVLAIVFGSPVWLVAWIITSSHGGDRLMAFVLSPMSALWGYVPRLLAVALMPAFVLALERVLEPGDRPRSRAIAAASVVGAAASWLHPWQGLVLVLVPIGLFAWDRFDKRGLVLAVPVIATALPLAYYGALHQFVPDWQRASENVNFFAAKDVLLVLVPFLAVAAFGVRDPGRDVHERMLLLWVAATGVCFVAPTGARFEALAGLSVPLAVLIVRAWRRLDLPRALGVAAMALTVAAGVVPLLADAPSDVRSGAGTAWLRDGDRAALKSIESAPGGGAVLADSHVAATTVALTGRPTWAAHASWSPQYVARATAVNATLAGSLRGADAERVAAAAGARFVFLDCGRADAPASGLRSLVRRERRFGCARVLELAGP